MKYSSNTTLSGLLTRTTKLMTMTGSSRNTGERRLRPTRRRKGTTTTSMHRITRHRLPQRIRTSLQTRRRNRRLVVVAASETSNAERSIHIECLSAPTRTVQRGQIGRSAKCITTTARRQSQFVPSRYVCIYVQHFPQPSIRALCSVLLRLCFASSLSENNPKRM